MFRNNIEVEIEKHEKRAQELLLKNNQLDGEVEEFFKELQLTPQQIDLFVNNPGNFSISNWQALQEERKRQEESLQRDLDNIRNPLKNKKNYVSRKVETSWIFVR